MERIILSAQDIAAVKVAIEICNSPEIKKEILCTPGSDYDIHNITYECGGKVKWDEIIEKKVTVIQEKLSIAKQLQEKVLGIVMLAGMRMLNWAEYHEGTLGISREYSFNFLNCSFFTQQGIIDNKKAAEELIKDESLNTKQKYKLACIYCLEDHIPLLYKNLTKEDKLNSRKIRQPKLVKFWSYYLMGEVDKLKGEKNLDQYRLEKAVESGSIAAVEYCLEKKNLKGKNEVIVVAAVKAVKCRTKATANDWLVFCHQSYKDSKISWVPSDYYVDILSFLLSKMEEDQQIEFFKKVVSCAVYKNISIRNQTRSSVLEFLFDWPYLDYFMKTVELMWEFLPQMYYTVLLRQICNKIASTEIIGMGRLKYGDEKIYDYRALLTEFWLQSPERYKRYVFSYQEVDPIQFKSVLVTPPGVKLLIDLISFFNFTFKDRQNVELILASATAKEKENLMSSEEWRDYCFWLMEEEEWEILYRITIVFLTKEEEDKFKKELCLTEEAKNICIKFVAKDSWNAIESFIKWSSLSEKEVYKLKKEMIYSEDGRHACVFLISPDKNLKDFSIFIRWCFHSDEEVKTFEKMLAFSDQGLHKSAILVLEDQLELVSEFINSCLSSEDEVRELKKKVAYKFGDSVCEDLISDFKDFDDNQGDVLGKSIAFKGSKWEKVEQFLTWCFSSEEEISDFKKKVLLIKSGVGIHFNLIKSNRWEEAEIFFAWLGLSVEEIKEMKKDTLFYDYAAKEMFCDLMSSEEGNEKFADYGSKQEAIELLLRWFLTDKETVLEFRGTFKSWYGKIVTGQLKALFENFDLAIAQRISDLDEEKMGDKRKSETYSLSKRHCNSKFGKILAEEDITLDN